MTGRSPAVPGPPPSDVVARLRAAGCVFAEEEAVLIVAAARTPAELDDLVAARVGGQRLEHVLGWSEFCGLRIEVDPGVFVPRPRSELLVSQAAALVRQRPDPTDERAAVVVDLCCGSGAVGAALAADLGRVELYAVDVDPVAVRCARRNLAAAGGRVYQGDLVEPLPPSLRGSVEVLVAHAPYVPSDALGLLPSDVRLNEPRVSLDGGADGLDIVRRIVAAAPFWLAPGGHLLFETSDRQAQKALEVVARHGLTPRVATDDDLGGTVVIGQRARAAAAGSG